MALACAAVVATPLAGCSAWESDRDRRAPEVAASGAIEVAPRGDVATSWVVGNRLEVGGGKSPTLEAAVNATLIGTLAPVGVPNRAGDAVAYNSWRGSRPTLRVHDLRTGRDSLIDEGAHSIAWATDGVLAYFKAVEPDLGDPRRYLGHVVVRRSVGTRAEPWTARPGRYVVAAWARGRVLFYRLGRSFPDLLVLDRPRRHRVLARAGGLVGVSPDGRRAFVTRYGASPPLVRVLDVATGRELARLRVRAADVKYVVASGSWVGDRVFAPTTTGVAVFRVRDRRIALEQVLSGGSQFPLGLSEPRARPGGRRFAAWGELPPRPRQPVAQAALVECNRITRRCVRAGVGSSVEPPRPLYNPSRP